jgi:hypothetical protein
MHWLNYLPIAAIGAAILPFVLDWWRALFRSDLQKVERAPGDW